MAGNTMLMLGVFMSGLQVTLSPDTSGSTGTMPVHRSYPAADISGFALNGNALPKPTDQIVPMPRSNVLSASTKILLTFTGPSPSTNALLRGFTIPQSAILNLTLPNGRLIKGVPVVAQSFNSLSVPPAMLGGGVLGTIVVGTSRLTTPFLASLSSSTAILICTVQQDISLLTPLTAAALY